MKLVFRLNKFILSSIFILGSIPVLGSQVAFTDQLGAEYSDLEQIVRVLQDGKTAFVFRTMYDSVHKNKSVLTESELKIFYELAKDQAGVWSDTILEGDYSADGNTELDKVEGVYNGKYLMFYRITYSERAWDTSGCEYMGEDRSELKKCRAGRIVESSFVSKSHDSWMRDSDAFAEFFE
jgi:hypothetical protein